MIDPSGDMVWDYHKAFPIPFGDTARGGKPNRYGWSWSPAPCLSDVPTGGSDW